MMRECEWDKLLLDANIRESETRMPRILKTDTEETLLQAIRDDSIFGFAICSVKTRNSDIDKMVKVSKVNIQTQYLY